ncbi:hypothetical protein FRB99_004980 [Tulasnella sp. 403]|nr:hypothetical protein FRB99_004980 [Tulasnella sp. 403]
MATRLLQEFPELSNLTRDDLGDLLSDPLYFQAIFFSLNRVKDLQKAQAELGSANENLAKRNLALQEELFRLRAETQAAFDEAKALRVRWKEVEREQKDAYSRLSPSFLLMRLRHAATAQDDLSENLASAFVLSQPDVPSGSEASGVSMPQASGVPWSSGDGGGADVDRFVREFRQMRKVYHKRVIWADRWASGKVAWRDD